MCVGQVRGGHAASPCRGSAKWFSGGVSDLYFILGDEAVHLGVGHQWPILRNHYARGERHVRRFHRRLRLEQ